MRTVLVTGGARGIGEAITRAFIARNCQVACGFHSSDERVARLAEEFPGAIAPVRYGLGDEGSARDAVRSVVETYGRLDSLVLNAGAWAGGRLESMSHEEWWHVIQQNVAGAAQLCAAALPELRSGLNPSIVVVSSVVGLIGFAGDTAYGSAKAALLGFALSLAKEVGRDDIRVNVVAPGLVDTDMTAEMPERTRDTVVSRLAIRRPGTAEEIAKAVVFLSEDATYCTGTVLTVDGGWSR